MTTHSPEPESDAEFIGAGSHRLFSSDADFDPQPPPGCPAHAPGASGAGRAGRGLPRKELGPQALGPGGVMRLYGPDHDADPMGIYERLREEHGAIAPVLLHDDLPAWLVLSYRENLVALRTPSRFSCDARLWNCQQQGRVRPDYPLAPITTWQPFATFMEGDEHRRLRDAVNESMNRFDARGIRRRIKRFSNLLVDQFCMDGTADMVDQFAEHLPMLVMIELLGMPEEYGPRLVDAARDMLRGTATAVSSNEYVMSTLGRLRERSRTNPGANLASWLCEHPARLTDDEVDQHLRLVLIAAYETTANLIANLLRMMLTDPRFRATLTGGHMTVPDAVEQSLWDEPPFTTMLGRFATGDTELGGRPIAEGDLVILGLAAANADTEVRPDLNRPVHGNRSHLAFGGGPHECPGADIGRAIADAGSEVLLSRLPDLRLAVAESELSWTTGLMSHHLQVLPVRFTPRLRSEDAAKVELPEQIGTVEVTPRRRGGGLAAAASSVNRRVRGRGNGKEPERVGGRTVAAGAAPGTRPAPMGAPVGAAEPQYRVAQPPPAPPASALPQQATAQGRMEWPAAVAGQGAGAGASAQQPVPQPQAMVQQPVQPPRHAAPAVGPMPPMPEPWTRPHWWMRVALWMDARWDRRNRGRRGRR